MQSVKTMPEIQRTTNHCPFTSSSELLISYSYVTAMTQTDVFTSKLIIAVQNSKAIKYGANVHSFSPWKKIFFNNIYLHKWTIEKTTK